ncbi:MAG TPA: hypothetical protein VMW19_10045 [Myxococcota bacterium]|nr:hypothetical protein [Myxococcota bacterium]
MKKPKGPKYRGLYVYRDRIWYERRIGERRFRENTGVPSDATNA